MKIFRKRKGSTIAETGPALFVFLLLIFFPLVDLIGLGLSFSCAWYLNHMVTRELACRTQAEGLSGQVANEVNTNYLRSGLALFLHITPADVQHQIQYPAAAAVGLPPTVICRTTVNARPMLVLPLPPNCPGLNLPMPLSFQSERPREETR
jgi:hypothetical protein